MASINDSDVTAYLTSLKLLIAQIDGENITGTTNLVALINTAKTFIKERRGEIDSNLSLLTNRVTIVQGLIKSIEEKRADTFLEERYDAFKTSAITLLNRSTYMDNSVARISILVDVYSREVKEYKRELKELNRSISFFGIQQAYYEDLESELTQLAAKAASA